MLGVLRQITCFVDPHMHLGTTCDFHKRQSSRSASIEYRPSSVLFVILKHLHISLSFLASRTLLF